MLCEFCKTFQQMPFKTFTQRKQTMSPRRSCYNPAFCCSASAQHSSSPVSELSLLPQHCLLLSPLKAQTQKSPILTQVLTKGPVPQENLGALLTSWSLLCQGSELPGHAGATHAVRAAKQTDVHSEFITFISGVCVFTLPLARVTNAVINSALHFS